MSDEVIVEMNGYMKLGDSNWIDSEGRYHEQPTPEGWIRADYVSWNGKLEHVQALVDTLPKNARFKVLISELKYPV